MDSDYEFVSMTASTTPSAVCSCSWSTKTIIHPTLSDLRKFVSPKMSHVKRLLHDSISAIVTQVIAQGKGVSTRVWWLCMTTVLFAIIQSSAAVGDLSLPFGLDASLSKSRFSSYVSPQERAIQVFVMKNISEDTPIGTVLDTFKAHDPSLPTFNYT
ncbi:hypothetical protein DICVIV_08030 [Dictyocaulus viviparus]|uniref:Uncharacterized protein n=1 Tax=Dictyocaulus viviparus TaxID=29172 RepID=A0A0D8XMQ9_DICVI|nr:hypothetical protein DICVIV_08030 [Dictyocaulus viviparus]